MASCQSSHPLFFFFLNLTLTPSLLSLSSIADAFCTNIMEMISGISECTCFEMGPRLIEISDLVLS